MKKLLYIIIVIVAISCTSQEEFPESHQLPSTRGIVDYNTNSVTNPTLLTDWENLTTIVLNTSTPTNPKTESLPWISGSTTLIPSYIRNDIKKEDGWSMLFHTFKNYGEDEKKNYIVFYNELRGILKVFYFLNETPYPNNHFIWSIQTDNSSNSSLFDSLFPLSAPMDATATNNKMIVTNLSQTPSYGLNYGWNAFILEIPYYSQEYRNLKFTIHGYNKQISDFSFIGKSDQTVKGTSITNVPDSDTDKNSNSKATLNGAEAKSGIDNFLNAPGVQLGSPVKQAIENAHNTGYPTAIINGLKYRGNISAYEGTSIATRTTESTEASYTTQGYITLDGSGSTILTSSVTSLAGISLYNQQKDLGVWSLISAPEIRYERYSTIQSTSWPTDPTYIYNGKVYSPTKRITATIRINPALEKYVEKEQVYYDIVSCDSINGKKYIRPYFSKKFQTEVLYRDNHIKLRECTNNKYFLISAHTVKGQRPLYDWGEINQDNDLILVTVKLTFNYNGKITTTVSSKLYKPIYVQDGDYIISHGGYYIVDHYTPPSL